MVDLMAGLDSAVGHIFEGRRKFFSAIMYCWNDLDNAGVEEKEDKTSWASTARSLLGFLHVHCPAPKEDKGFTVKSAPKSLSTLGEVFQAKLNEEAAADVAKEEAAADVVEAADKEKKRVAKNLAAKGKRDLKRARKNHPATGAASSVSSVIVETVAKVSERAPACENCFGLDLVYPCPSCGAPGQYDSPVKNMDFTRV
jgi:hypothetical protein